MPLYKLKSVKISKDVGGERKLYPIGSVLEMSEEEAKQYGSRVEKVEPMQFTPDSDDKLEAKIQEVLDQNVTEVTDYLNDNADDKELLEALRDAEKEGKNRKTVLDAIDELLSDTE